MKNPLLKTAVIWTITASVLVSWAFAMTDKQLSDYILKQVVSEENLNADEVSKVKEDIEDISQKDILQELKAEILGVSDETLKKDLKSKYKKLEWQEDAQSFFTNIDEIYTSLDAFYEENDQDFWEMSYEGERKEIIESLNEELTYVSENDDIVKQITASIKKLEETTGEESFFDTLDAESVKIDSLYEKNFPEEVFGDDEDIDFTETKKEILEELTWELEDVNNTELTVLINKTLANVSAEDDEEGFFENIESIYDTLDYFYEKNPDVFDNIEWDDDLQEAEDLDFSDVGEEIIDELEAIDNPELTTQIKEALTKISWDEDEDVLSEKIDWIYNTLDTFYENNPDVLDNDENDFEDEEDNLDTDYEEDDFEDDYSEETI